jgi:hypothetical protein
MAKMSRGPMTVTSQAPMLSDSTGPTLATALLVPTLRPCRPVLLTA